MASPVRIAVASSPDYPFTPIDAPVKLDQNESSDDFPSELKAKVAERIMSLPWNRYPDLHSNTLCDAIASFEGWPASGVVVTTGSNVLIALLTQLSGLGKRVVTVKPNFALYALGAKLLEVDVTELPLKADFSLDVAAVMTELQKERIKPGSGGVLYLAQPHAPTGSGASFEEISSVVEAAEGWLVVIDEAYHQFSGRDFKALATKYSNVVLLRTFSKAWGLAGMRLGYVLTSDHIAQQLRKLVPPFTTSVMQTVVAQVALANPGYMQERTRQVISERERLYSALQQHPTWQVFPSEGNFLLIRTPDAGSAFKQLLAHGVLVRRQDSYFGLSGCIRVSIGSPEENDKFLEAAGLLNQISASRRRA